MARNWLASAELPASFWFYAVCRAAEVCNYFPFKLENGTWSTPFELAYQEKPDLRVLFKMFSLAAVRQERDGNSQLGKIEAQSIPAIVVGRCPNSTGYNPVNGTFLSSTDYKLQPNVTSGAYFGLKYQPGVFFYRLDESTHIFAPKFQLDTQAFVHTHSPPSVGKIIGIPTYTTPNIYTVAFKDGSISEYTGNFLSVAPTCVPPLSLLPSWIQGGANAMLFLQSMSKPSHGVLHQSNEGDWFFYPGKSTTNDILLSDLSANYQTLADTGQLFQGHKKFKNVYDTRVQLGLSDCVLCHVSTHGLTLLLAPMSL